jgi:probable phosphoglycerate mutase
MYPFNKRLFILRHGETEFNKAHILQGQVDSPLTELGIKQAKDVAEKAEKLGIGILATSDLKRAVSTADIISGIIGLPITRIDSVFRERSFGDMDGVFLGDIRKMYPQFITDEGKFILEHDLKTGEPVKVFYDRVINAIEALMKEFARKNIMLITHKGVLNMMYAYANDIPLDKVRIVYNPDNCEIANY